jgi:hypothetical protein
MDHMFRQWAMRSTRCKHHRDVRTQEAQPSYGAHAPSVDQPQDDRRIRKELAVLNINEFTIYSGLDNLGNWLTAAYRQVR